MGGVATLVLPTPTAASPISLTLPSVWSRCSARARQAPAQPPWHAYTAQAKPHWKDGATWEAVQKGQLETLRQACGEPLHVQLIGVSALGLQENLCQQRTPPSAWLVHSW